MGRAESTTTVVEPPQDSPGHPQGIFCTWCPKPRFELPSRTGNHAQYNVHASLSKSMPLSLSCLFAPRLQRTGRLCALSLVLPNSLSRHTAAVLTSVKPPLESVSQASLQDPPLAAGQQL